jgi:xanthine dehydrogenase large subunit
VREAIRAAVAAFGATGVVTLDSPATPERIYWAVEHARAAGKISVAPVTGAIR